MENKISGMVTENRLKVGSVFFDDIHDHASGYASIAGNPSKKIQGTQDLDSDVIWITNLPYENLTFSGFTGHARFRTSTFLRTDITRISDFIGVPKNNPSHRAECIAIIVSNVLEITKQIFGFSIIPDGDLKKAIREKIWRTDFSLPDFVVEALEDATVSWVPVARSGKPFKTGVSDRVIFRIHPKRTLKAILKEKIPFGYSWTKHTISDPSKIKYLVQERPFLAKVNISKINPEMNDVLNFGGGKSLLKGARREWITSVELKTLSEIADVYVKEIIVASDNRFISHPALDKIMGMDNAYCMSLSYNLFLENVWSAISTNHSPSQKGNRNFKSFINPAIPFVRTIDREICMSAASQILKAGFDVYGYGTGGVYVRLTGEETEEDFLNAALLSNTIPPAFPGQTRLDVKPIMGEISTPLKVLQALHLKGETDNILELDKKIMGVFS